MTTPNIEELITDLQGQAYEISISYRVEAIEEAVKALQSQAERIATLEDDVEFLQEDIDVMYNAIPDYHWSGAAAVLIAECFAERDSLRTENAELRVQLADAELHTKQVERGLDKATAQLAEIEKTEPVAWRWVWKSKPWDIEGWCYTNTPPNHPELQEIEKLFTHPMPAQRLTELKLLMLTTAYEQGVGKGIQRRDCNPYAADTDEHAAWALGYEEGRNKPMPAQDVTGLVDALEEIDSWLVCAAIATPDDMAQSFTHMEQVASTALSKYKKTKQ